MGSFIWIILAVGAYGTLHSLLASRRAKTLAERWLGEPGKRFYRLFFSIQAGVTFLPVLAAVYFLPDASIYTLPPPWRQIALGLQGACTAGIALTLIQTGALAFLGLDAFRKPNHRTGTPSLQVGGLYRMVRHPVYTLSILLLFLTPTMTWNWLGLAVGASLYMILAIPLEEDKLVEEFGDAYRQYQHRVPALVPGFRPRRG